VDGIAQGNPIMGTIRSSGPYSPPAIWGNAHRDGNLRRSEFFVGLAQAAVSEGPLIWNDVGGIVERRTGCE
jgi:hypothetical protein